MNTASVTSIALPGRSPMNTCAAALSTVAAADRRASEPDQGHAANFVPARDGASPAAHAMPTSLPHGTPRRVPGTGDPTQLARRGLYAAVLLVAAVAIWVATAPMHGAVTAPGVVKVDMNRKPVQHQEGGILGELLVRDGQKVVAGQVLMRLRNVQIDANRDLVKTQLDAELAKIARLEAEQSYAARPTFPDELLARAAEPRVAELLRREQDQFRTRRDALLAQLALIRAQIAETRAEIGARTAQLGADVQAADLQRQELAANEALVDRGFVSAARMMTLRRATVQLDARRMENQAELSRTRQKVTDLELRAETARATYVGEATDEMRRATVQAFDLREKLRPTEDAELRQRIVAPIAGEVVDLRVAGPGTVIGPRETLLEIVPEGAELVIEARIRPEDIDAVRAGAQADLRLTAFRSRNTPTVTAIVSYVSADRLIDRNTGEPYYAAHLRTSPDALRSAGGLRLQAGMPAEVFVRTEARTVLQYLLDPITGFLQRAMRER